MGLIQLGVSEEYFSSATPIVSLASLIMQSKSSSKIRQVLNAKKFRSEEQDWLCLNLALSLLHISGRDWNRPIWYSDNPNEDIGIYFLRDPSTEEIFDKTRPYISWRVQEESGVQELAWKCRYDTQLLDFASLLIEIRMWERLDLKLGTAMEEERRSRLLKCIKDNLRPRADREFIMAIEACLSQAGHTEAAAKGKPERIQAYVFENIVKPLHRYLGNPELPTSTMMTMPSSDNDTLDDSNLSENDRPIYDVVENKKPGKRESVFESFTPRKQ